MPFILDSLNTDELFQAIHQDGDTVTISFLGSLNNERDYDELLRKLLNVLENKKLEVDLSYVTELESRGKSFLLQLQFLVDSSLRSIFQHVGRRVISL